MALVYLSLGSNIDRYRHISNALDQLSEQFGQLQISSVFESESVGFLGSNFLNLVVGIHSVLPVAELSFSLKKIEDENGRDRTGPKFSPRTLDIDMLTYDDQVGDTDGVQLPRDEIEKNAFVLQPLAQIAPTEIHPLRHKSYADLWEQYQSSQKLWAVEFNWRGKTISKV